MTSTPETASTSESDAEAEPAAESVDAPEDGVVSDDDAAADAPVITAQPPSVACAAGTVASFSVTAVGTDPLA